VTFDHNGVFHLVQLPGLLCLLRGVLVGLGPRPAGEPGAHVLLPSAAKLT
jgi:hypothetical protein